MSDQTIKLTDLGERLTGDSKEDNLVLIPDLFELCGDNELCFYVNKGGVIKSLHMNQCVALRPEHYIVT